MDAIDSVNRFELLVIAFAVERRWLIDHGPASAPAKWNPSWLRASGMCPFRNQLCRISIRADTAKADRREVDPPIQV
jgi:hypothetical protein